MVQLTPQFLSQIEFKFDIKRLPNTKFFVQRVTTPSLDLDFIRQPTPLYDSFRTAGKMNFGDLTVEFKVDEDMKNYEEIYDWMIGLGFPRNNSEFKDLDEGMGLYSDATLTILTSQKNPNVGFSFQKLFPVNLSSLDMDMTADDVEYITSTVQFRYDTFELIRYR